MTLEGERKSLLADKKKKHYGAATDKDQPSISKTPKLPKGVPLTKLFQYATCWDVFLMTLGSLFAIIHGAGWPALAIVFGGMTESFIQQSQAGFQENGLNVSNNLGLDNGSLFLNNPTPQSATMPSTKVADSPGSMFDSVLPELFNTMMTTFALYYVYIGLAVMVAAYFQLVCWCVTCERQIYKLRQDFFYQVLRQEIKWFDARQSGELAMKLNDDLERVREGIGDKFSMFIQYFSTFIAGFVVGFISSWQLTLVIMSLTPLMAINAAIMGKLVATSSAREQQKYAIAGSIGEEVLSCIRTVISFCGQKREMERYTQALKEGRDIAIRKYFVMGITLGFTFLVLYGSYALAFWYGSRMLLANQITGGSVFTVFFAVMIGSFSLGNAMPYLTSVSTAKGSARTIFDIIDSQPQIDAYSDVGLQPENFTANIQLNNISFNYPARPSVRVLRNLSLNIQEGQTIALCGHSGSGKSTIVNLLLRFYNPSSGNIVIGGYDILDLNVRWLRTMIGIVSQEPILFDCSIAENIRYGNNDVHFENIVEAAKNANAHDFIAALPCGYDTIVGERGAQLSGGQKQRIAIARALVRDPKILLLDEATSALDAESESVVQEALDKARQGRTTIVVAHRLSTIKNADMICAMANGEIAEQGTHKELMDKEELYYQLVTHQIFLDNTGYSTSESAGAAELVRQRQERRSRSLRKASSIHGEKDLKKIVEELQKANVEIPSGLRILKESRPEWPFLFYGSIGAIIAGGIMPAYAVFYAEIFNTFTLTGKALQDAAFFWSMMFLVLAVTAFIANFIRTLFYSKSGEMLTMRLRERAFANILRQDAGWFDNEQNSSGRLSTRLATDVPMAKTAAGHRIGIVITAISTLGTSLVIAYIFGWKLALALTASLPILLAVGGLQMKIMKGNQLRDAELMADAGKVVTESIENVHTVQALTLEPTFIAKFAIHLLLPYRESIKNAFVTAVAFAFSEGVIFLLYAGAFRLGAYFVTTGDMEAVDVYRVFFALAFSAVSVGQWVSYLPDYTKAKLACGMIFHLIEKVPDIDSLSPNGVKPPLRGEVTLSDLNFRYPNRADVPVLRGLNLNVQPGQTLALVGPSGCGKSTVVSLVQRFYDPQQGQVKVDDFDIRTLNLPYLRRHIAVVSQEPVLFNCSIRDNITYGLEETIPQEQIEAAAKNANVHDFIRNLPQGYDTTVGEKGTQLSGGQKQRIAIARALVRNPKILLLDEATSALDTESEKLVQDAIDRARQGRTCLVIAHRLSTIQSANCIAVIDRGVVAEKGTHEELILRKGPYYRLTKKQRIRH